MQIHTKNKNKGMNMFKKLIIVSMLATFPLLAAESTGVVTKISDGSTLHMVLGQSEETIKILYIDVPEKFSNAKLNRDAKKLGVSAKDIQELGKLASDYASKFFKKGDKVIVESDKKDQAGRILATVNKNSVDYSLQMIEDGFACINKKAAYPGELEKALKNAKEEKKGLWAINYDIMNKLCR